MLWNHFHEQLQLVQNSQYQKRICLIYFQAWETIFVNPWHFFENNYYKRNIYNISSWISFGGQSAKKVLFPMEFQISEKSFAKMCNLLLFLIFIFLFSYCFIFLFLISFFLFLISFFLFLISTQILNLRKEFCQDAQPFQFQKQNFPLPKIYLCIPKSIGTINKHITYSNIENKEKFIFNTMVVF